MDVFFNGCNLNNKVTYCNVLSAEVMLLPSILISLLVFAKMIKKNLIARQIQRLQTAIEFQRKKETRNNLLLK